MIPTTLADLMAQPGRILGTWSQFADPDLIDLIGAAGYRFTIIDGEHGAFGVATVAALVRACEAARVVPLVRVPRGDSVFISKVLDAGAAGVLGPSIETAAEAQALVAATQFAPNGNRGACPIVRAAGHSLTPWTKTSAQQSGVGAIAMIETQAGVQQCEAILDVADLAGLMIGPFDLSVSLGLAGQIDHPTVSAAVDRLLDAAASAKKPVWMPAFAADPQAMQKQITYWTSRGIRHFAIGADKIIVATALHAYLQAGAAAPS